MLRDLRYVGNGHLIYSWAFIVSNSWKVLLMEKAIPVIPQGSCVCYTSHSELLILVFSGSELDKCVSDYLLGKSYMCTI